MNPSRDGPNHLSRLRRMEEALIGGQAAGCDSRGAGWDGIWALGGNDETSRGSRDDAGSVGRLVDNTRAFYIRFGIRRVRRTRNCERAATYSQMLNAVNKVAWILDQSVGKSAAFDTLAYLGPSDLRYHIVLLAAIKTRYKVFNLLEKFSFYSLT